MQRTQLTQIRQRGALRLNTAQVLIILIALVGAGVVYNAYQQAHPPPPLPASQTTLPVRDPQLKRYARQVAGWQAKLTRRQMKLTWPYLGQDNVARLDLPGKTPVVLQDWDARSEGQAARQAYLGFVRARKEARVAHAEACIVHVFDASGEEVAQASLAGVVTSAEQSIGG